MLKSFFGKNNQIKFICHEEDWGVIPKPYSSKKYIPDWFKHLPMRVNEEEKLKNSTVKRCIPFLDAMSIGYIIPLAADVEIVTNEDASGVEYKTNFYKEIITNHDKKQVTTRKTPAPHSDFPPMKFMNYWLIQTPPGWSTLFIPPINREDSNFTCFGGLVDTDKYFQFINFPFIFKKPNFTGILQAGTPLVQAIPIKRSELLNKNEIAKFSKKDYDEQKLVQRQMASHESYYRDQLVEKK